jgi:hypothetical protein
MSDLLHERVARAACARDENARREDTSAIYAMAMALVPGLLDRLLHVHQLASQERGEAEPPQSDTAAMGHCERKKMLSAVRAAVHRTRRRKRAARTPV